jgi:hypothetical protein
MGDKAEAQESINMTEVGTALPRVQSIEEKERLIATVPIVIQKNSLGVPLIAQEQDTKKQERIVGVMGDQYMMSTNGPTATYRYMVMTMKYDSDTKIITLSDRTHESQLPLQDVDVVKTEPNFHHIAISLPHKYVMTRRPVKPAPTKSSNNSVTKLRAPQPRAAVRMGLVPSDTRGGTKYKKSMKNKRKTKKHKSRRYRKIK